jgi:hypothetical protein
MAIKIITDPVTGKKFSRDDSIPGSQFAPYETPLSGTSAAQEPSLPQGPTPTASPYQLPSSQGKSSILEFANTLDQAVNLAKQNRNKTSLDIMKPHRGTVAASDFNSILGNINAASDSRSSDLTEQALSLSEESSSGGGKLFTSGTLTLTPDEDKEILNILQTGTTNTGTKYGNERGADGYVDPRVYLNLLDIWRQNGGQVSDFTGKYPPRDYINPKNAWIKGELESRNVAWNPAGKEPSSGGSGGFSTTQKLKLEQAGLLNADRQKQLDFLFDDDPYAGLIQ